MSGRAEVDGSRFEELTGSLLDRLGLVRIREERRPESFGSWWIECGAPEGTGVRLVWDGRDGVGSVQRSTGVGGWRTLQQYRSEASLQDWRERAGELPRLLGR